MRETLFPDRTKNKDKSIRNFDSHCIDSYSIGVLGYIEITKDYRSFVSFPIKKLYSIAVRFINRLKYKYRRELVRVRSKYKKLSDYFRYKAAGISYPIIHMSRLVRLRTKRYLTGSNHGDIWEYSYSTPSPTCKKVMVKYGGTSNNGVSKYWLGHHYGYYSIQIS